MPHVISRLVMSALAIACYVLTLFVSNVVLGPQAGQGEEIYMALLGGVSGATIGIIGYVNIPSASRFLRSVWVVMFAFIGAANFPYVGGVMRGMQYLTNVNLVVVVALVAMLWLHGLYLMVGARLTAWRNVRRQLAVRKQALLATAALAPKPQPPQPPKQPVRYTAPHDDAHVQNFLASFQHDTDADTQDHRSPGARLAAEMRHGMRSNPPPFVPDGVAAQ